MRTKASGAKFIMDVSKRVYPTLMLIPRYVSHFWPTYSSLHSEHRDVLLIKKTFRSPAPVLHAPHTPLASLDPTRHTLSPLTRFFLGLDRTLHFRICPLRLLITNPVNTVFAHTLWSVDAADRHWPAHGFYLCKAKPSSAPAPVAEGRLKRVH